LTIRRENQVSLRHACCRLDELFDTAEAIPHVSAALRLAEIKPKSNFETAVDMPDARRPTWPLW
jgi:hypothetical protein